METPRIIICDDERSTLGCIGNLIEAYFDGNCKVARFDNAASLEIHLYEVVKGNIDIVFLDIDLNDRNGIDLAKTIKVSYPHIRVIFITGYIDFAQNIFEADPTYFLVKPVTAERLSRSLETAIKALKEDKQSAISFTAKGTVIHIRLDDIRYIESRKRIVYLHEADLTREIYDKLNDLEGRLPSNFLRCHQSFIVNMDKARHLNSSHFLMYSGEQVPVSQLKYGDAKKRFMSYLGDSLWI